MPSDMDLLCTMLPTITPPNYYFTSYKRQRTAVAKIYLCVTFLDNFAQTIGIRAFKVNDPEKAKKGRIKHEQKQLALVKGVSRSAMSCWLSELFLWS